MSYIFYTRIIRLNLHVTDYMEFLHCYITYKDWEIERHSISPEGQTISLYLCLYLVIVNFKKVVPQLEVSLLDALIDKPIASSLKKHRFVSRPHTTCSFQSIASFRPSSASFGGSQSLSNGSHSHKTRCSNLGVLPLRRRNRTPTQCLFPTLWSPACLCTVCHIPDTHKE